MFLRIKKRIEKELRAYIRDVYKLYPFINACPLLPKTIRNFILRKGKRIRPILFIIAYLGLTRKIAHRLYRSAISVELLHNFLLVHDDIIDKSETRRGSPSMHAMLNGYLKDYKGIKFNGQDLAIVAADIIYALALSTFLSIKENTKRKEEALKKFIESVIYTGSGEYLELLAGIKDIDKITKEDIYKIYDLKTANYTFASPLAIGATLAGAGRKQVKKISAYGTYLGRAFQIKDDIIGLFAKEKETGKSNLTDLKEGKKTILIWSAYRRADKKDKTFIKKVLSRSNVGKKELRRVRRIIVSYGALRFAEEEISRLMQKAYKLNALSGMRPAYRNFLDRYSRQLLKSYEDKSG